MELLGLFFTDPGPAPSSIGSSSTTASRTAAATSTTRAPCGARARSEHWIGDVLIRAGAVGTETYEINRNLLLSDGPRADSVPNLEIETGDVASAGHASVDRPARRRSALLPHGARDPRTGGPQVGRHRILRRAA